MARHPIPAHPVVDEGWRRRFEGFVPADIQLEGPLTPGARALEPRYYTLGHDSDWSAECHPLEVGLALPDPRWLDCLFGPQGLVCGDAVIGLALEWGSDSSARRGMGDVVRYRLGGSDPAGCSLRVYLGPGSVRGTVVFDLVLFVLQPGVPREDEGHLANTSGFRLGSLAAVWRVVVDGDGSLFPIVQEPGSVDGPLWEYRKDWDEPDVDPFDEDHVRLVVYDGHPDFRVLKGSDESPFDTPLFRQVLGCWLALLFEDLERDAPDVWNRIVADEDAGFEPGSIAAAARYLSRTGGIDHATLALRVKTSLAWVDRAVRPARRTG